MSNSIGSMRVGAIGASALLAAIAVGGCGGGSSSGPPPATATATAVDSVSPSAATSVQALVDYQKSLQATESTEPMKTQGFLAPNNETSEPFAL